MIPPYTFFFFFNDTATTEIYTLSLHDALPISQSEEIRREVPPNLADLPLVVRRDVPLPPWQDAPLPDRSEQRQHRRSEEHTSELQSLAYLVCRLLLEKKKKETQ